VTTTELDPSKKMIVVDDAVWVPRGKAPLRLVVDTGSWQTLIVPDVMDDLGFSPRDGLAITAVYSAIGKEQGYMIGVPRFSALGYTVPEFSVHVFDLADRYGIDGLLGLSFLQRYNYQVRSAEGLILVEEIAA
jgi:predicted aspartyl protease